MKVLVKTYGCQMNERDSETMRAVLAGSGHELVAGESAAEAIVLNTCSVRDKAEEKALGKLRLLVAARAGRPVPIIGATGCMVQRLKQGIFDKVPGLDFALGSFRHGAVAEAIEMARAGRRQVLDAGDRDPCCAEQLHLAGKVSAFISVLYGCNRRCSYCVVPEVRGREKSRPAKSIVAEAADLVEGGTEEIILLGQSILSYGRANPVWDGKEPSPLGFREPFPRLLEALSRLEGLKRLRFMSGHPSGCTGELARAFAELPALAPHVHLPLQSGSDRILKLMNRGYTVAGYRAAVARLRAAVPAIAVTTDVILGFPSETIEDFDLTRALMDEIKFSNAFIFKYSPRPGTKAAALADDVPATEKMRRNQVILEEQNRTSLALNREWIGRECRVLVEGRSKRNPRRWTGRSETNVIVVFGDKPAVRPGDCVRVLVDRAEEQVLYGSVAGSGW